MPLPDPLPIRPIGRFTVELRPPGSKSLTNRALLLAALAEGRSRLSHVLFADDTRVMIDALTRLGFQLDVDEPGRTIVVQGENGTIPAEEAELDLGNAGTAMRFLAAACCLGRGTYTLDGVPRMRQRPIGELVDPLRRLGADIEYLGEEGFPPLRIHAAGLRGGELTMPPTLSSQYVSALLLIEPLCERGIRLGFEGSITSLPYVHMTLKLMERFGVRRVLRADMSGIDASPGGGDGYSAADYAIEPDASNASYFLAAAAITPGSQCTIEGLGKLSIQGDRRFARILADMGAEVEATKDHIQVTGPAALRGVDASLNNMPDMAQTLAVIALFTQGETVIRDVGNLRVKETNRLAALETELSKLGASAKVRGDDLHVSMPAPGRLRPADIDTYDDHRMAMSFAVAGLRSEGVRIKDPACVNKTFPEFWQYLDRLREGAL